MTELNFMVDRGAGLGLLVANVELTETSACVLRQVLLNTEEWESGHYI